MSVVEIMHQIEALPAKERWEILEHTRHLLEPDVPQEFKEGMAAIARGEVIDLDEAMPELRGE
jgi:predicted transcriptional regulator